MAFEVITTTDKAQRDQMFDDLRKNGNRLEKQAVKFSGAQRDVTTDRTIQYPGKDGRMQFRPGYISTWSVAYPTR